MQNLNQETFNYIVNLLIPFFVESKTRRTSIDLAIYGCDVIEQIDFSGTARDFTVHLVKILLQYGDCDGEQALIALLQYLKTQVGNSQQLPFNDTIRKILSGEIEKPQDNYGQNALNGKHIFIAYSRHNIEIVRRITTDLLNAGVNIWLDIMGLLPGTIDWEEAIREAIQNADDVLYIASPEARKSRYVRAELDISYRYAKRIIPLWIDGEHWIDAIPMTFSYIQYTNMRDTAYVSGLRELLTTLGIQAPKSQEKQPVQVVQPPKPKVQTPDHMTIEEAEAIARAFKGTKNSDWTPIIKTFEVKGIEFEMCLVPPGSFMMGSDDGHENEKPVHQQTITEPYWIGLHPVTNEQWRKAVENSNGIIKVPRWTDWYNENQKTKHPVAGVIWFQCVDFAKWLGWRLPTELEWEYAARGLDNLVYPFGNDVKPDLVVFRENSNKSTAAIGGRPKGAAWIGAQDMSGNVWEWMSSSYKAYPYKVDDGRENLSSNNARVVRGGSFLYDLRSARAASRPSIAFDVRNGHLGFRVCASPVSSGL